MTKITQFPPFENNNSRNSNRHISLKEFLTNKYYDACREVQFHSKFDNVAVSIHTANTLKRLIPPMQSDGQSDLDTIMKLKNLLPKLWNETELWYKSQKF